VSALILDAGALIAIDRGDRDVLARVNDADKAGDPVRTNAMAVAQVWRGSGGRQARLAKALRDITVEPITREDGMRAGELLGATRTRDAIDASVALLAGPGDRVLTSDAGDLRALCRGAGNKAVVIDC
jgi:hypothetical protein